jgi:hypothetical protein
MIVQVSQKIFMADDEKRLPVDVELIRAIKLFHTCQRFIRNGRETYICDEVAFNYNTGKYYCSNVECNRELPFKDVSADGKGTGWEGNA